MNPHEAMLSLAAGVLPDADPLTTIDAAAAAGFDGVGVWFDPDTWTEATTRAVADRLDASGLVPLDMEPVFVTPDGDHGDRLIDAAVEVGARNVLTVGLGVSVDEFAERFAQLCDRAAPAGLTVNVECGRLFAVSSLPEAQRVLALVERPNAGILLDNIHLDRAGHSQTEVAAVDPEHVRYAQICDAPASLDDESRPGLVVDAMDLRSNLGEGGLDWRGFLAALPDATPLSLEIRSAALRDGYPDPTDRARRVLAVTRAALAAI